MKVFQLSGSMLPVNHTAHLPFSQHFFSFYSSSYLLDRLLCGLVPLMCLLWPPLPDTTTSFPLPDRLLETLQWYPFLEYFYYKKETVRQLERATFQRSEDHGVMSTSCVKSPFGRISSPGPFSKLCSFLSPPLLPSTWEPDPSSLAHVARAAVGGRGRAPRAQLPICSLNRKETKVPFEGCCLFPCLVAEPPGGKAFEVFPREMVANKSAVGWYSS